MGRGGSSRGGEGEGRGGKRGVEKGEGERKERVTHHSGVHGMSSQK